jgi:tRNA-splicing ligase RtcB (3'-phosphate/5'-hydroxy nucleic acid ligase)
VDEGVAQVKGDDLIRLGFKPGKRFGEVLQVANNLEKMGVDEAEIVRLLRHTYPEEPPALPLQDYGDVPFENFLDLSNGLPDAAWEIQNAVAVIETMKEVMKTPVVKAAAIMPDACPAGPLGTIPVGGVVKSEHVHPGMHSADICCSMYATIFDSTVQAKELLDAVHEVTHFGPISLSRVPEAMPSAQLMNWIEKNPITARYKQHAISHFMSQGDGNHFAFVGYLKSTGKVALVTHHGSRGFGAMIYKHGIKIAESYRRKLSPETRPVNAWIPSNTQDGRDYWDALMIVREWTEQNHGVIHDRAAQLAGLKAEFIHWNEHNFVFRKADGYFYHAKGATPCYRKDEIAIIPMNMREPILLVKGLDHEGALGFGPHGAGRNYSRTQHRNLTKHLTTEQMLEIETKGLDIRFYSGSPDISELPSAYKNAATVKNAMIDLGLAEVIDEIIPYGCIMGGEFSYYKSAPVPA